jgi:hypothetical protein
MNNVRPAIAAAILTASVVWPILAWRHSRAALRGQNEALQRQEREIAALQRGNPRVISNALPNQASLSEEQLRELLKLRGEAAALRRQTNEDTARLTLAVARPDSGTARADDHVSTQSEDERAVELATNTLDAMKGVLQALPDALETFAREHTGKAPEDFSELRKYFPKIDGARRPGLYTFRFVREEGPKPGDTLILKEQSWRSRSGIAVKVYGFSNGQASEVTFPEDDQARRNFANWEREHLGASPQAAGESFQPSQE